MRSGYLLGYMTLPEHERHGSSVIRIKLKCAQKTRLATPHGPELRIPLFIEG